MKALAAFLTVAALLAPSGLVAQEQGTPATKPLSHLVPMVPQTHPSPPRVTGTRAIDIPQWAKDAGHNGSATWRVTVAPDGKPIAFEIARSSKSPAIDAAARAWVEDAHYLPATDAVGAEVEGKVDIRLEYARWDDESPGGGLGDYRCADLVREADWFAAANVGERKIFAPENFYTSLPGLRAMRDGAPTPSRAERERVYTERGREWQAVVKRCRGTPAALFLDQIDDPAFYRSLVESF